MYLYAPTKTHIVFTALDQFYYRMDRANARDVEDCWLVFNGDIMEIENLPTSLPEKQESFKKDGYLEHWMYVWELKKLLDQLNPTDWLIPNEVHNLQISRDKGPIGYIDFLFNDINIDKKEKNGK